MSGAMIAGIIGILVLIIPFQMNERRTILRVQLVGCIIWAVHYLLLGAMTASGLMLLTAIRNYFFENYRKQMWVYWGTIVIFSVITILTWKNWTSVLPLIGSILATTAMWQEKPRNIRLISLTVTPFWLTYNFLNGSYPGMAGDLVTFASVVIGIYRFDLQQLLARRRQRSEPEEVFDYTEPVEA